MIYQFWSGFCFKSIYQNLSEMLVVTMSFCSHRMSINFSLQGEVVSMRMPDDIDMRAVEHQQAGVLYFDDGSQKTLAGFMAWIGLIALSEEFEEEEYQAPGVTTLLRSLMNIGTIYKHGFDDPVDTMISRVIKQNSDSKVQPINSFQWAVLLQTMFKADDTVTLDDAMQRYNQHPEVQAQGGKMTAT